MSSTYSTNLRTELIGSGDQAGTWGNTTNTSLGSILEQAIAGVSGGPYISGTYPAVNFPTDADITLTANNGSVDQSRSMVLVITSSGSLTATRNVIAPASASKVYIIKNSTTGGQSIQIKYSTGTGVTIGNAQTMVVYGDGTNFYNGETALTNLTVNGNLAVSGNETISGTLSVTGTTSFTGIPSGPTAAAGTNTTQLATTAFATTAIQTIYPVGSIYTSTVSTNPNTLFGFGTWVAFGAGQVMIGNGGGFTAGSTGGSADAIVVSHTHTATSNVTDPSHSHDTGAGGNFTILNGGSIVAATAGGSNLGIVSNTGTATTGITVATTNATAGTSGTGANLQPYIVVYMWNRTA